MACSLEKDTSGQDDFTSKTGSNATVKVTSTTPNVSAGFVKAELNKKSLQIHNGDTITFTVASGENTLDLVIAVSDPNCTVQLLEDCGGSTQVLDTFVNDPADPVVGYSIFGDGPGTDDPGPHLA